VSFLVPKLRTVRIFSEGLIGACYLLFKFSGLVIPPTATEIAVISGDGAYSGVGEIFRGG
jgi:hypothetical protein